MARGVNQASDAFGRFILVDRMSLKFLVLFPTSRAGGSRPNTPLLIQFHAPGQQCAHECPALAPGPLVCSRVTVPSRVSSTRGGFHDTDGFIRTPVADVDNDRTSPELFLGVRPWSGQPQVVSSARRTILAGAAESNGFRQGNAQGPCKLSRPGTSFNSSDNSTVGM